MGIKLRTSISSQTLAQALGLRHVGPEVSLNNIAQLSEIQGGSLSFQVRSGELSAQSSAAVIGVEDLKTTLTHLVSPQPRLDFVRALHWLNSREILPALTAPADIHPSVQVGQNSFIGSNCHIGAGTVIGHNVVIAAGVTIGRDCKIKSGAVIGEDGFGFERDQNGVPLRMLHLGSVVIGDRVEIGSLTTVCRGTLSDTWIGNDVKIDDHVHVAHNVSIADRSIITACAEISGGVSIGEESWLAPNISILEKVKIAPKTFIGLGAVVIKNTEVGGTYIGNPARKLEK